MNCKSRVGVFSIILPYVINNRGLSISLILHNFALIIIATIISYSERSSRIKNG